MAVKNDISIQTFVAAKENGFACSDRCGTDFPRLILIFAAAKENGPPAATVAATLSVSDSNLRCCEGEWPACSGRRDNDVRVRF